MSSRQTFKVRKHFRLAEPFGSKGFNRLFDPVLAKLQEFHTKRQIHAEPQRVMLILDELNATRRIPAANYNKLLTVFDHDDCRTIDRLLQVTGVVEPSLVFEDEFAFDAALTPGIYYTSAELTDLIFQPKTGLSLDLADPAAYAARVPGESLYDLVEIPQLNRCALVRLLQIAGETEADRNKQAENAVSLQLYENRDAKGRVQDAKTLAALIFTYASDSYPDVHAKAKELSVNYALVFNKPEEIKSLLVLKNYLSAAAEKTAAKDIIQLAEQVTKAIKYREAHQEKDGISDEEKFWRDMGVTHSVNTKNKRVT